MDDEDYGPCPNCGATVSVEELGGCQCGATLCMYCHEGHTHEELPQDTKPQNPPSESEV